MLGVVVTDTLLNKFIPVNYGIRNTNTKHTTTNVHNIYNQRNYPLSDGLVVGLSKVSMQTFLTICDELIAKDKIEYNKYHIDIKSNLLGKNTKDEDISLRSLRHLLTEVTSNSSGNKMKKNYNANDVLTRKDYELFIQALGM